MAVPERRGRGPVTPEGTRQEYGRRVAFLPFSLVWCHVPHKTDRDRLSAPGAHPVRCGPPGPPHARVWSRRAAEVRGRPRGGCWEPSAGVGAAGGRAAGHRGAGPGAGWAAGGDRGAGAPDTHWAWPGRAPSAMGPSGLLARSPGSSREAGRARPEPDLERRRRWPGPRCGAGLGGAAGARVVDAVGAGPAPPASAAQSASGPGLQPSLLASALGRATVWSRPRGSANPQFHPQGAPHPLPRLGPGQRDSPAVPGSAPPASPAQAPGAGEGGESPWSAREEARQSRGVHGGR